MKDLVRDHDERLDKALATLSEKLTAVAARQHEAMNAAQIAFNSAMESSLQDAAAAMQAFSAEADETTKVMREQMALRTADFFGDGGPKLPEAGALPLPPFRLVIDGEGNRGQRGHSALWGTASSIVTETGDVIKSRLGEGDHGEPIATEPEVSLHETEVREVAKANGLDLSLPRDVFKALGFAIARKVAGIAANAESKAAAESAPRDPPAAPPLAAQ